jgi:hypothetical protein
MDDLMLDLQEIAKILNDINNKNLDEKIISAPIVGGTSLTGMHPSPISGARLDVHEGMERREKKHVH